MTSQRRDLCRRWELPRSGKLAFLICLVLFAFAPLLYAGPVANADSPKDGTAGGGPASELATEATSAASPATVPPDQVAWTID